MPKTRAKVKKSVPPAAPTAKAATAPAHAEEQSEIAKLAAKHWLGSKPKYTKKCVDAVARHLADAHFAKRTLQELERTQYLERLLWPHFSESSTDIHVLSVLLMINEKHQEKLLATLWPVVQDSFAMLFARATKIARKTVGSDDLSIGVFGQTEVRTVVTQFLIACFGSLETECVRAACLPLVGISIWQNIGAKAGIEAEFERVPALKKLWKHTMKKFKPGKTQPDELAVLTNQRDFLALWIKALLAALYQDQTAGFCMKAVELLIDLLSQLATRRYVKLLLVDYQVLELCARSELYKDGAFRALVGVLEKAVYFQVDDVTGQALSEFDAKDRQYQSLVGLQMVAFKQFPKQLEDLVVSSTRALGDSSTLTKHLQVLEDSELRRLADVLGVRGEPMVELGNVEFIDGETYMNEFIICAIANRFRTRETVADQVRGISPYPTESSLFSNLITDADNYGKPTGTPSLQYPVLPIPKLNLQFLTLHDYLSRSFELFQLESGYEIREDVKDAVKRLMPKVDEDNVYFAGWARMAMPLSSFTIVDVQRPKIGQNAPSKVRADLAIDLKAYTETVRLEWETEVRPHDVLILITVAGQANGKHIIKYVRGCEVESYVDSTSTDTLRTFRVLLDANQYHSDLKQSNKDGEDDVYGSFNVVLRRRPQENNFKAVLETIRELMVADEALPEWLAPTFLGYGDPAAAVKVRASNTVAFGDTFVDEEHLRECFDGYAIQGQFSKPCTVVFAESDQKTLTISGAPKQTTGPFQILQRRQNSVRFTAAQVSAIQSASHPGLTMIVGPPGTGKTDVAVQIISNLYHAHPDQKTLLVTHSNQALNQLFEKIIDLDIEPRHLLRLGHGEEELESEERYSKAGRVESYLERRQFLLGQVQRLARDMGAVGDFGYTCETARMFFVTHVKVKWAAYQRKLNSGEPTRDCVAAGFPFGAFFEESATTALFPDEASGEELVEIATSCYQYIADMFDELQDIQPFELLRSSYDRSNYLLTNQARIVAMTCTHAALKRSDLLQLGFHYDTVVMEEAAQVLDIETFVPLAMQKTSRRLKRAVLIGDHNQLPPVVKSQGLKAFGNLEQSLFARMVRLGVPYVELNRQARARPEIADLYRFRYTSLGDLSSVSTGAFAAPNPGLANAFQFINTEDLDGQGESEPTKHFYQNVAEAEYAVAMYQYMRLLGYPAETIAILTTYNGQRALLNDVLKRRCSWLPYFGSPKAIATVDQFQGQQADYIICSLVRTKAVGHIRDLRRFTVAVSRARLGLYVLGRRNVFESCFELQLPMQRLLENGDKLVTCKNERYGMEVSEKRECRTVESMVEMGKIVFDMSQVYVQESEAGGAGNAMAVDETEETEQMAADDQAEDLALE